MIQYKCDLCGIEGIEKKDIEVFTMPRILRHYATDAMGVKLQTFERYSTAETHLCEICCMKIAGMFTIVEPDE